MMAEAEESSRTLRPASDVLTELWDALWRIDTIRSLDLESLSMSIQAEELLLEGHLSSETNRWHIRAIAREVAGPLAVEDHLVVDRDLEVEVALALAGDERTRPLVLPVACEHGWIWLGGEVPDPQIREEAETVAAKVPHGRGIVGLPKVTGKPLPPMPRVLQPRPGARVWGEDGEVGLVAQVVIDPRNRLVTDMVVASNEVHQSNRLQGGYVVPIDAIEIANTQEIFLTHPYRSITSFLTLDTSAYPQAPATWRPPYPYTTGTVRWRQGAQPPVAEHLTACLVPAEQLNSSQTPGLAPRVEGGNMRESARAFVKEVRNETP